MANPLSVADILEMTQLSYKYARALDSKDFELFHEVFTPDVLFEEPDSPIEGLRFKGLEALLAYIPRFTVQSQHTTTNHEFMADGDQARGSVYGVTQHWRPELPNEFYLSGCRYEDRYVKTNGRWLITERRAHNLWHSGNEAVLEGL